MQVRAIVLLCALCAASGMMADELAPAELPCAPGVAFGHQYGSTKINGMVSVVMNSIGVASKPEYSPFDEIDIGVSEKSRRVWSVLGRTTFEDAQTARSFIDELVARFEAAMPIVDEVVDADDDSRTVTLYTGTEEECVEFGGERKCYHSDGEKIEIAYYAQSIYPHTVTLACSDISMEKIILAEALGRE